MFYDRNIEGLWVMGKKDFLFCHSPFIDVSPICGHSPYSSKVIGFGMAEAAHLHPKHFKTVMLIKMKVYSILIGQFIQHVPVQRAKAGVKVKLSDRMKALQWLSDHMDLATEKQRAEIALLNARANAGKDDREEKLDSYFERFPGLALRFLCFQIRYNP